MLTHSRGYRQHPTLISPGQFDAPFRPMFGTGCDIDTRPTLESIAGAYSRYYTKPHSRAEVMSRRTPSRA